MRSASADRIVALIERVEKIVPEIVGMLKANADAKQTGRHVLLALPTASSIDRCLDTAQARRPNDEVQ